MHWEEWMVLSKGMKEAGRSQGKQDRIRKQQKLRNVGIMNGELSMAITPIH